MPLRPFLLSLPERAVRSLSALAGGLAREVGDLALPARVRRTRLYQTMVDSTLRFLIEQVGQVEGAYPVESGLPADFLVRRTAGNALEVAGIAAFHASPVWVLAALADLSGAGRELIVEIAGELKQDGLLEPDRTFDSADQLLDGIERAAGRLAESINTPPLDAAALKAEWARLREEVRAVPLAGLPSPAALGEAWRELLREAAAQGRSVTQLSSAMAVAAVRRLPENARRLSRAALVGARRTGQVLGQGLLDHYGAALDEMRKTGYARYWMREFRPYLQGALRQFSPRRPSLTERLLERRW